MILHTWQFLVLALAGWLNRQQQDIVAYLAEENRVLREQMKGKQIRFTDEQRRRANISNYLSLKSMIDTKSSRNTRTPAEYWNHTPWASAHDKLALSCRPV